MPDIFDKVRSEESFKSISPKFEFDKESEERYELNKKISNIITNSNFEHEAGYDAFISGFCFLSIINFSLFEETQKLSHFPLFPQNSFPPLLKDSLNVVCISNCHFDFYVDNENRKKKYIFKKILIFFTFFFFTSFQ